MKSNSSNTSIWILNYSYVGGTMVVLGWQLNLMILEVFSNHNDSVIYMN